MLKQEEYNMGHKIETCEKIGTGTWKGNFPNLYLVNHYTPVCIHFMDKNVVSYFLFSPKLHTLMIIYQDKGTAVWKLE